MTHQKEGWVLGAIALLALNLAAGCRRPDTSACGKLICPVGLVCVEELPACVLPEQLEACTGLGQGDVCTYEDQAIHGLCDKQGVCIGSCGNGVVDTLTNEGCDDGNALSGDGCSSQCIQEVPTWTELDPLQPILAQEGAMVYDLHRRRLVRFGGGSVDTGVLMEHDGRQWYRRELREGMSTRAGLSMVYHAARRKTVAFGGLLNQRFYKDTWEYDGKRWTQIQAGPGPDARRAAASTYDAGRSEMVLFGGFYRETRRPEGDGGAAGPRPDGAPQTGPAERFVFGDTWVYDGRWHKRDVPGPSPRWGAKMAYDAARRVVLLFGGRDKQGGLLFDTWEWDGVAWTQVATATAPHPNPLGALGYDAHRKQMVLFGGAAGAGVAAVQTKVLDGTWTFDGVAKTWKRLDLAVSPSARADALIAYDAHRRLLVLYGGDISPDFDTVAGELNDTWAYNGRAWVQQPSLATPLPRAAPGLVYDELRGVVFLWSGMDQAGAVPEVSPVSQTVWALQRRAENSQWLAVETLGRPEGRVVAASYDSVRARSIFIVERPESVATMRTFDTYTFDGRRFELLAADSPGGIFCAMVYDEARRRTVLYGGQDDLSIRGETWFLSEKGVWSRFDGSAPSPPRTDVGLVYDPKRQKVLLIGGTAERRLPKDSRSEPTDWILESSGWVELPKSADVSTGRVGAAVAHHRAAGLLIAADGEGAQGPMRFETWSMDSETSQWSRMAMREVPPRSRAPRMVYDRIDKSLLFVGEGYAANVGVWRFAFLSPTGREDCDDGVDNDSDGLVDCADPDCEDSPCGAGLQRCVLATKACSCAGSTKEQHCSDGYDDDCDGLTDCADPDCAEDVFCKAESDCGDGKDDDGDSAADCRDPGCRGKGFCEDIETSCDDGKDNDGDGYTDCEDTDCFLAVKTAGDAFVCTDVTPTPTP